MALNKSQPSIRGGNLTCISQQSELNQSRASTRGRIFLSVAFSPRTHSNMRTWDSRLESLIPNISAELAKSQNCSSKGYEAAVQQDSAPNCGAHLELVRLGLIFAKIRQQPSYPDRAVRWAIHKSSTWWKTRDMTALCSGVSGTGHTSGAFIDAMESPRTFKWPR